MAKRPSVEEQAEREHLFRRTEKGKGKERYPSDRDTPAVACRVSREEYEELQAIAQETGDPLAHVLRAALWDFLERYRRGQVTLAKENVNETWEFQRVVTRVVTSRNEQVTSL